MVIQTTTNDYIITTDFHQLDCQLFFIGKAVNAINEAMADYTRLTCIRFARRSNQPDYVRFYRGNG